MAFGRGGTTGSSPLGGRALGGGGQRPLSDINVTPLVDVMLVLLVIFIITAPLMASSIRLDLPQSGTAQPAETPRFLALAVDAQGRVFLDGRPVDAAQLADGLARAAAASRDTEVQLRADRSLPYGRIVELMDAVHQAGLARIAFVAQAPAAKP